MLGQVKWFNEAKGFGFITTEDVDDVFVSYKSIKGEGFKTLHEGDKVELDVARGKHGLLALNVRVVNE